MSEFTKKTIIRAAKKAARKAGHTLSRADFERLTGISQHHIYRVFPDGGWTQVKQLAGLERHPKAKTPLSDEELLAEFHRIAESLGKMPTWSLFAASATVSAAVVSRRFGGLQGTLARYRSWLEANCPDSPMLVELQARSRHEIRVPPSPAMTSGISVPSEWTKSAGPEFGAPINFRGL